MSASGSEVVPANGIRIAYETFGDRGALSRGDVSSAAYTLDDMAEDGFGLLDALGLTVTHVLGASLGGMIAQTMAARHPDRVRRKCPG